MAPERGADWLARLGALLLSPRRLARRDLDRRDGKASDDLIAIGSFALLANGAPSVVRAAAALSAGRTGTAIHRLLEVLRPVGPLVALWLVSAAALFLFTFRCGRRAVLELGARVLTGFLLAMLLTAPIAALLEPGPARYILASLPWAVAAVLFGLVLREAVEPPADPAAPVPAFASASRWCGFIVILLMLASGVQHAVRAVAEMKNDPIEAQRGKLAPAIDLPLVGPGRLHLEGLRGRRVVLSFWASWCGPCMEELPQLENVFRARGPDAALVYAVNIDEPGPDRERAVRAVVQRFGLTMPIALDDGTAKDAYSVSTIPTLVRIGTDGKIVWVLDRSIDRAALIDALH